MRRGVDGERSGGARGKDVDPGRDQRGAQFVGVVEADQKRACLGKTEIYAICVYLSCWREAGQQR
ncbi:hypothetical protein D3C81_1850850 [compost metagenome]